MSPKAVLSIVIWVVCLSGLFGGLLIWGNHVERRDRARRFSTTPILQRGDLGEGYRIFPSEQGKQSILASILHSTGATDSAQLEVEMQPPHDVTAQVLYLLYPSASAAAQAVGEWYRLLGMPARQSTAAPEVTVGKHGTCAALWQRGQMVVIVMAPNSMDAAQVVRAIADSADQRLQRWTAKAAEQQTAIP